MTHEHWTDLLSDYLDGDLDTERAAAVEDHVAACDVCRSDLDQLRTVVALARSAPVAAPERDLWPGIAARLHGRETAAAPEGGEATAASGARPPAREATAAPGARLPDVRPLGAATVAPRRRTPAYGRRFSFSAPQLAAAAVLLMALSGGAVWLLQPRGPELASGTILQTAAAGVPVRLASEPVPEPDPAVRREVDELERLLEENRSRLDPATVQVVEESLSSIDRAIGDARAALEADPGNPHLHRHLDNTLRRKADVLRLATRGSRGT